MRRDTDPMTRLVALLATAALAACASPSPEYLGSPAVRFTHDSTRYALWRRGDAAQIIRLDHAFAASQRPTPARLVAALEAETGCIVRPQSVQGDSGVLNARIDCPQDGAD